MPIFFVILVTVLPWALLALGLWWIARRLRPRPSSAEAALTPA